jgi:hypothetical protein
VTGSIGTAGRRAQRLAQERVQTARDAGSARPPLSHPVDVAAPLFVQAATAGPALPATEEGAAAGIVASPPADEAIEREMPSPSAEEVADRVYRLFRDDLRRERERLGR